MAWYNMRAFSSGFLFPAIYEQSIPVGIDTPYKDITHTFYLKVYLRSTYSKRGFILPPVMGKERTIPDSVKDTVNLLLDQGVKVKEISNITKLSDGKIRSMRINKGRYGAVSRPHAPPSGPPRSINSGMEQVSLDRAL